MIPIVVTGKPISWKRARTHGKRFYDAQAHEKEKVRWQVKSQCNQAAFTGALCVTFKFFFEPAKNHTWIKKKQMFNNVLRHIQKPDLSNLIKFYEDALNGILWEDDKLIYSYGTSTGKYWGEQAKTIIIVEEKWS